MIGGIYYNPTKVFFGQDIESTLGNEVKKHADKILILYGGESLKKYGCFDKITKSLDAAGVKYFELGGVKPNPTEEIVYQGIDICRREKIDFVLAAGGGSVIDSAKAIGVGVPYDGDFFELFEKRITPEKSIRVGVVLTVSGAGSETGAGAVITHAKKNRKIDCSGPVMFPLFAFLNPEVTFTVPEYYTSCGIVDSIAHLLERYFSPTTYVDCSDRLCEGLIKTLMKYAPLVRKEPENYDIRAEIMWASKLAHDNCAGFGRKQDWACHLISHEIGVLNATPHGAILSVVFPAWMRYVSKIKDDKFIQFAQRVMDVAPCENHVQTIAEGTKRFEAFLKSIGMPVRLREINFEKKLIPEVAEKCGHLTQSGTLGNYFRVSPQDIEDILNSAY